MRAETYKWSPGRTSNLSRGSAGEEYSEYFHFLWPHPDSYSKPMCGSMERVKICVRQRTFPYPVFLHRVFGLVLSQEFVHFAGRNLRPRNTDSTQAIFATQALPHHGQKIGKEFLLPKSLT